MSSFLLSFIVFSPLIGIVILSFIKKESILKIVGIISTLPALLLTGGIYFSGIPLSHFVEKKQWISFSSFSIDYELAIDEFSLIMLSLTAVIAVCSAIASIHMKTALRAYFMLFLLLEIGMLGVFVAQNLVLFFLFFEMTIIPLFFLIGRWGYAKKERTAFYFLIYNGLGSALLLIVLAVLFAKTGTTNILTLKEILENSNVHELSANLKLGLFVTLFIAFGIKLPIFPFHSWVVKVHSQAPIPIVMLHSGILLKIGAYGLIRFGFNLFPNEFAKFSFSIMILGVVNLLYGACLALIAKQFKRVLAFATISHMGIVLIGLGALNEAGIQGAIFQVISHGLISALFFLLVGIIAERTRETELMDIGRLAKGMPIASGCLLMAGMASLGLPGTSGFISEFTVFLGVFKIAPVIASIAAFSLILTAAYILRAVLKVTFGLEKYRAAGLVDIKPLEKIPVILLMALIIGIGIYPNSLAKPLQQTVETINKSWEVDG